MILTVLCNSSQWHNVNSAYQHFKEYAPYKSNCNCNGSLSQDTTGMTPREKYLRRVFGSQVPRNSVIYSAPYLSGEYLRSLLSQHPTNNLGKNLFFMSHRLWILSPIHYVQLRYTIRFKLRCTGVSRCHTETSENKSLIYCSLVLFLVVVCIQGTLRDVYTAWKKSKLVSESEPNGTESVVSHV